MKKKIISIFLVLAMLIPLMACTTNTTAYLDATKKVENWKGSVIKSDLTYDFEITNPEDGKKVNIKVPAKMEGLSQGQKLGKVKMSLDLKELKAELSKIDNNKKETMDELKNIKDSISFEMFVDNNRVIISKNLFTDLMPDSLKDIKENYIELPNQEGLNTESYKYLSSEEFKADILDLYKTALPGFKPVKDFQVKGNTYLYEASSDDILADIQNGLNIAISNWEKIVEKLLPILEKIEMPKESVNKEDLLKLKDSYNKAEIEKSLAELKNTLKGSKISVKDTFEENKFKQDFSLTLNIEKIAKFNLKMDSVYEKNDNAKVEIPTDVKKLSQKEFAEVLGSSDGENLVMIRLNGKVLEGEDSFGKIINNRTMIPARSLFESMGAKVSYDQAKKEVTLKSDKKEIKLTIGKDTALVDGKEVKLDSPASIIENKTYLPVRFIGEALGYKVKYQKDKFFPIVDLYNVEDSKLEELIKTEQEKALEEAKKTIKENKEKAKEEVKEEENKDAKEEVKKDADEKIKDTAKEASKILFSFVR